MQNLDNVTFELKHGFYAIIEMENKGFKQMDIPEKTFEKALVYAYEVTADIEDARIAHLGNYDVERKIKEDK